MKKLSDKCQIGTLSLLKVGTLNIKTPTSKGSLVSETSTVTSSTWHKNYKINLNSVLTKSSAKPSLRISMDKREALKCF